MIVGVGDQRCWGVATSSAGLSKKKLVGNEPKGLRTNFPKWREPQTKLYLIYHFTRTILLLKSLTTSDVDRFSYPQYT